MCMCVGVCVCVYGLGGIQISESVLSSFEDLHLLVYLIIYFTAGLFVNLFHNWFTYLFNQNEKYPNFDNIHLKVKICFFSDFCLIIFQF